MDGVPIIMSCPEKPHAQMVVLHPASCGILDVANRTCSASIAALTAAASSRSSRSRAAASAALVSSDTSAAASVARSVSRSTMSSRAACAVNSAAESTERLSHYRCLALPLVSSYDGWPTSRYTPC